MNSTANANPATPHRHIAFFGTALVAIWLLFAFSVQAQSFSINDAVRTYPSLTNTVVTMTERAELWLTNSGDPMAGSVIPWTHLMHGWY